MTETKPEKKCKHDGGINIFLEKPMVMCNLCAEHFDTVLDYVNTRLASQKSEFENEKHELFAEWARQKIELTERNKNLLAKVLEIIDKAMKFNQKTKDAYLKYGKPMKKADYEMIIWTEIRKRIEAI